MGHGLTLTADYYLAADLAPEKQNAAVPSPAPSSPKQHFPLSPAAMGEYTGSYYSDELDVPV
jgi:hypothetical protein